VKFLIFGGHSIGISYRDIPTLGDPPSIDLLLEGEEMVSGFYVKVSRTLSIGSCLFSETCVCCMGETASYNEKLKSQ